jgi:hypothetical protein
MTSLHPGTTELPYPMLVGATDRSQDGRRPGKGDEKVLLPVRGPTQHWGRDPESYLANPLLHLSLYTWPDRFTSQSAAFRPIRRERTDGR